MSVKKIPDFRTSCCSKTKQTIIVQQRPLDYKITANATEFTEDHGSRNNISKLPKQTWKACRPRKRIYTCPPQHLTQYRKSLDKHSTRNVTLWHEAISTWVHVLSFSPQLTQFEDVILATNLSPVNCTVNILYWT